MNVCRISCGLMPAVSDDTALRAQQRGARAGSRASRSNPLPIRIIHIPPSACSPTAASARCGSTARRISGGNPVNVRRRSATRRKSVVWLNGPARRDCRTAVCRGPLLAASPPGSLDSYRDRAPGFACSSGQSPQPCEANVNIDSDSLALTQHEGLSRSRD